MTEQSLRVLPSQRMRLIAATAGLVEDDLNGREKLAETLEVVVPDNWPPDLFDKPAMELARHNLRDPAEQGWSFWYLTRHAEQPELIGICGFKGRPDDYGCVEIAYSILSQFRNQGFATEAVTCLTLWAFSHQHVAEVCAETMPHLQQSIRVLEKNGFVYTGAGSEQGVVRYAINRSNLQ